MGDVDPELRTGLARIAWFQRVPYKVLRTLIRLAPAAPVRDVGLERVARNGVEKLRVYTPPTRTSDAALLWIHGGGFVIGDARQDQPFVADLVREAGIVVVSANYRLAPEHPFPAQLTDVVGAYRWLRAHAARLGVDPARIVVGGQSAGGTLAAALAQLVHDAAARGSSDRLLGQLLLSPKLDDRPSADRSLDTPRELIWDNRTTRSTWRAYLGREFGTEETVPAYAVPARRDDLSGLPPAFLSVGDIELFHDEVVAYAGRLEAAGVPTRLVVTPGAPHGFENWGRGTNAAAAFMKHVYAWLSSLTAR